VECGALNRYLHPTLFTATFGAWAPCTGGASYTIDHFGKGDSAPGCPDLIPFIAALDGKGIRYNLQRLGTSTPGSNLQTFLVMITDEGTNIESGLIGSPQGASRYAGPRLEEERVLTPKLTRSEFLRSIRRDFGAGSGGRR
jgi:hypothetical protein